MSALSAVLRRKAGDFVVDLEIEAKPGITILFGPSGAGKSSTLSMIAGLARPDTGRVALGERVWFDSDRGLDVPIDARRIGFVFQSLALFPHLTASDNVAFGLPRALSRKERQSKALEMLERFKVGHLERRKPRTFSGGEAQRVALARAFAISPSLLLLDEPFSALDRSLRRDLHQDLRNLVDSTKLPTILITHHPNEARALGDHLIAVRGGRVERQGPPSEVLRDQNERSEQSGEGRFDFADTPMATPESLL